MIEISLNSVIECDKKIAMCITFLFKCTQNTFTHTLLHCGTHYITQYVWKKNVEKSDRLLTAVT